MTFLVIKTVPDESVNGQLNFQSMSSTSKSAMQKSKVLVDFVVEWMELSSEVEGKLPETPWEVDCNGA
jgi:hypothetical protein